MQYCCGPAQSNKRDVYVLCYTCNFTCLVLQHLCVRALFGIRPVCQAALPSPALTMTSTLTPTSVLA